MYGWNRFKSEVYSLPLVVSRLTWTALCYDSPEPTTSDALPLCKKWLQNCLTTHKSCRPSKWPLPTSLVNIGGDEPRLCLSSELNECPYATLSHCWGSLRFTTLTNENIDQFRRKIPSTAMLWIHTSPGLQKLPTSVSKIGDFLVPPIHSQQLSNPLF